MNSDNDHIVYVFGDSHCVIFVGAEHKFKSCVCGLDSASITGLNRTDSKLEYGKYIIDIIKYQLKSHKVLLKLGQVDMEFVMYHKLYLKHETFTFQEYCQSLIDKYREFIKKVLEINSNVIIASINLPSYNMDVNVCDYIIRIITNNLASLKDTLNQDMEMLESKIDPNLKLSNLASEQLTKNFVYFNNLLSDLAKEMGLPFFDTTPLFMDSETGLLKTKYTDYGHHYKGYYDDSADTKLITHNFFHSFLESYDSINNII